MSDCIEVIEVFLNLEFLSVFIEVIHLNMEDYDFNHRWRRFYRW